MVIDSLYTFILLLDPTPNPKLYNLSIQCITSSKPLPLLQYLILTQLIHYR